ncbi:MAG: hypothetical protein RID91_17575, partial [Azospirillaceae bacterium]
MAKRPPPEPRRGPPLARPAVPTEDERALWRQVVRDVRPIAPKDVIASLPDPPAAAPEEESAAAPAPAGRPRRAPSPAP